jgi:hypothetical protein
VSQTARYSPEEEQRIKDTVARAEEPTCPRDGGKMTARSIGGGSFGLGYARSRQWLICPTCKRSVIIDQKRGTRN